MVKTEGKDKQDKMNELISIIVPIYNVADYLEKCIESLLNQTLKNIEIILIDDGSSDESACIGAKYVKQDARIKFIAQENGGVSKARNRGIKEATGKYIMFCDSDDMVKKNWCELLYSALEENILAISEICFVYDRTNEKRIEEFPTQILDEAELIRNGKIYLDGKDFLAIHPGFLLGSVCNKIYLRQTLLHNKVAFDENISYGEDLLFNLRYIKYIDKIVCIKEAAYLYYQYEKPGLCKRADNKSIEHRLEMYEETKKISILLGGEKNFIKFRDPYYSNMLNYLYFQMEKGNLHQNNRLLRSEEFADCMKYSSKEGFDPKLIWCLNKKDWRYVILLKKLSQIRRKLYRT